MMKTYLVNTDVFVQTLPPSVKAPQDCGWIEFKIDPTDLYSLNQVASKTGLSKATIQRRIKEGSFPRSQITDIYRKKNFWTKLSVLGWIDLQKYDGPLPEAYLNAKLSDETDDAVQSLEETGRYLTKKEGDALFEMRQAMNHDFAAFCEAHPRLKEWLETRKSFPTKNDE